KSEFSDTERDGYVRLIQIRDYKTDAHIVYVDKNSTKKFCNRDDVMIGRYGPPVFQILRGLEGAYNVALMKAVPDENVLSKDYLFAFLQSSPIQSYIVGLSQRAAGQSGVNKKALENYSIPIPPLTEQKRIVKKL
ncbi:restriction endonuclease subunit S, partial [Vibrio cholerae]|nr:restriction endonuclease subunit S [Vibrio cholerae]